MKSLHPSEIRRIVCNPFHPLRKVQPGEILPLGKATVPVALAGTENQPRRVVFNTEGNSPKATLRNGR